MVSFRKKNSTLNSRFVSLTRFYGAREPKIPKFAPSIGSEHDIGWLDVSVDDPSRVTRREGFQYVHHDAFRNGQGKSRRVSLEKAG